MKDEKTIERRTDLALEVRESIPEDDKEVKGVVLTKKSYASNTVFVTTVKIKDDHGAKTMGKPKGTYVTVESKDLPEELGDHKPIQEQLYKVLAKIMGNVKDKLILVAGLGNAVVTSDSIGPKVINQLKMNRHLIKEFGDDYKNEYCHGILCGIAPGVMGQTGLEAAQIIEALVRKIKPDMLIAIDALAARNLGRLCTTIQITDTGISPGAGVGNHRRELTRESLGIPVIAIGIPTVVDAKTIIADQLEQVLSKQGYSEDEIAGFVGGVVTTDMQNMFVTPGNIDEATRFSSGDISEVLNQLFTKQC